MYSFTSRVRFSETNQDERLTLTALIDYMQDCSTFESEDLGLGLRKLREQGRAWLLSTWNIYVDELPCFGDELVISTWAYGFTKVFGLRNYTIATPCGRTFARADSQWFVYSFADNAAIKVPQRDNELYMSNAEPRLDIPKMRRKVEVPAAGERLAPITVAEQHIDSNHHVNNAQYVAMALRAAGLRFETGQIDVQYKRAAKLGDVVVPRLCEVEGGTVVALEDEKGDAFAAVRLLPGECGA